MENNSVFEFESTVTETVKIRNLAPVGYSTLQRQFETNIPRKGTARLQFQFLHHVSVSDLCIPLTGLPILLQENT